MQKKSCIAMLLAGGQGSRLGALTRKLAKPAVSFGGKYRIIDFALSNCAQSGIDTVGVLTQYKPVLLNAYLGTGRAWDLDEASGGVFALPPYQAEWGGVWYKGTANAIYQHMDFISRYDPETVLIISGDHIYRMDYAKMLEYHRQKGAAVTISTIAVPWEEASRFGILTSDEDGRIVAFDEKPKQPRSNLASMGIYIFDWSVLSRALAEDEADAASDNDFGKNVIPKLLAEGAPLYAYNFEGYWRDVGTLESYYNANMEFLSDDPPFDLYASENRVYSSNNIHAPTYLGPKALVQHSIVTNGCAVLGTVRHSVLSREVTVGEGAVVEDSILLPGAQIGAGCRVSRAVVGEDAVLSPGAVLGAEGEGEPPQWGISVVADKAVIAGDSVLPRGTNVFAEGD